MSKFVILNFEGIWLRKAQLNLDWSKFVKIEVLTRKYIYNLSSETPNMFLNFISMFNKPGPNIDTLKEFDMSEILGQIRKMEFCCYHSQISHFFP